MTDILTDGLMEEEVVTEDTNAQKYTRDIILRYGEIRTLLKRCTLDHNLDFARNTKTNRRWDSGKNTILFKDKKRIIHYRMGVHFW